MVVDLRYTRCNCFVCDFSRLLVMYLADDRCELRRDYGACDGCDDACVTSGACGFCNTLGGL